jgi:hypothetical protein
MPRTKQTARKRPQVGNYQVLPVPPKTHSDKTLPETEVNSEFADKLWSVDDEGHIVTWKEGELSKTLVQDVDPRLIKVHHGTKDLRGRDFLKFDGIIYDVANFVPIEGTPEAVEATFEEEDASLEKLKSSCDIGL